MVEGLARRNPATGKMKVHIAVSFDYKVLIPAKDSEKDTLGDEDTSNCFLK